MQELLRLDATAQAELVRTGQVSPAELAEAAIARIEALNGALNAVTVPLYDRARRQLAAPLPDGPFKGVPHLVKDLVAIRGEVLTYGSRLFQRNVARHNEAIVDRALKAGLVILGKTNTAEFGLLPVTEPLLCGPSRNPWNLDYSSGGSSGGAAAAVAAGLTAIAQGGDGGGSIRIPASCCGVFGFKPGRGLLVPRLLNTAGDLAVNSCLTRSVRDTARFFEIAEAKPRGALARLGYVPGASRRRLRIAYSTRDLLGLEPDPEVKAATDAAARLCADLGHTVEEATPVFDGAAAVRHFVAFWAAGPAFLLRNYWMLRLKTLFRYRMRDGLEPWTMGLADWYRREEGKTPGLVNRAKAFFKGVERETDQFFARYDVHLTPVMRKLPPRIGEYAPTVPFEELLNGCIGQITYTPLHNALGTPAMSVPLAMSRDGLPIGIQFAAGPGRDRTLLELAYELEEAAPWAGRWPELAELRGD